MLVCGVLDGGERCKGEASVWSRFFCARYCCQNVALMPNISIGGVPCILQPKSYNAGHLTCIAQSDIVGTRNVRPVTVWW